MLVSTGRDLSKIGLIARGKSSYKRNCVCSTAALRLPGDGVPKRIEIVGTPTRRRRPACRFPPGGELKASSEAITPRSQSREDTGERTNRLQASALLAISTDRSTLRLQAPFSGSRLRAH
jgi:hypothetical protein